MIPSFVNMKRGLGIGAEFEPFLFRIAMILGTIYKENGIL